MTNDEKIEQMQVMLGEEYKPSLLGVYLRKAQSMILNKRFPFGYEDDQEIEPKYEQLQIELAICLFNERGAEGQKSHNENGVSRSWRTKDEIMLEVVPYASVL
jgi:hypothetical protein